MHFIFICTYLLENPLLNLYVIAQTSKTHLISTKKKYLGYHNL